MKAHLFASTGFVPWQPDISPQDPNAREVGFNERLHKQIKRLQAIMSRLADKEGVAVVSASLFDAIVLCYLIKLDVIDVTEEGTFFLTRRFKRTPDMVVAIYRACEYATRLQQQGEEADGHLLELLEPRNWEQVEPAPRQLKPLIRMVRKELPGSFAEIRSMSLDQFWSIVRRRLVAEGFIEWRPYR